ncbi:hypothetical protein ACFPIJ_32500 [Dactylosporangium cerinum]|uniref:Uncharacterized protein n=1 Tax=Dactylosporangium cerinum TaxID=1434730 RepID=A0ABV9W2M9_9ACTN
MARDKDPFVLAGRVEDATVELAMLLREDVSIDPAHVIVPLMATMGGLTAAVEEIARAAVSVDEEAAVVLRRAAGLFMQARGDLQEALMRLPVVAPRGTLYGARLDPPPAPARLVPRDAPPD